MLSIFATVIAKLLSLVVELAQTLWRAIFHRRDRPKPTGPHPT